LVRLGKVDIAVKTFGACDFSRWAVTDWRSRRWRLWFLALMTATRKVELNPMYLVFFLTLVLEKIVSLTLMGESRGIVAARRSAAGAAM